jgi:hypothetical protein
VVFRNLQHLSGSAKSDLPGVCPREV